jgi:hypothetical protein
MRATMEKRLPETKTRPGTGKNVSLPLPWTEISSDFSREAPDTTNQILITTEHPPDLSTVLADGIYFGLHIYCHASRRPLAGSKPNLRFLYPVWFQFNIWIVFVETDVPA